MNSHKSKLQKWGERHPRLSDSIVGVLVSMLYLGMLLYMMWNWESA